MNSEEVDSYREQIRCGFKEIDPVFADCVANAKRLLSVDGFDDYLHGASQICRIGRGVEPVLIYLEELPIVASVIGESTLFLVSQGVWRMSRTPNGAAIPHFLQTIAEAARRLGSEESFERYIDLMMGMMNRTTRSVHGFHSTIPSAGFPNLLDHIPYLLSQLSLEGLKNWIDYGVAHYNTHPERQKDYFSLQSADSKAMLQRERHGTLFADHERVMDLYLRALWQEESHFVPYSLGFDELRKPQPYYDYLGMRIPDVYDDLNGVSGINRYRATIAHMAAHQRWTEAIFADNFSPLQRVTIEALEDSRVECLILEEFPGLRPIFLALHPLPNENDCNPEKESCIRHRLAIWSRAAIDPDYQYKNPIIHDFIVQFHALLAEDGSSTQDIANLAIRFAAKTRLQSDQLANVIFTDTEVSYRDDNRHMWRFIEEGDEEEMFEEKSENPIEDAEMDELPPRYYHEWDYKSNYYRPDYVSLYENLHPSGNASDIDKLLEKHSALAKRLKQILDELKPQRYVRIRYQEDGSELDLDVAIRSLIDFKCGAQPDPRINMSHTHDGRDIAVMILLDLSESLNDVPDGCSQSILELSQEAVSLLGWAIDHIGDKFAIAGFSSNTRHEVRYHHIKGFSEKWDDQVKGRLAGMKAAYSTRMGAALRHASHYLGSQQADKKLLLVLTDGEPSDIDVPDERMLIEDCHKEVQELDQDGIYTYCISLDRKADDYIKDIFDNQYSVIDRVERLPEKLPQIFTALTS